MPLEEEMIDRLEILPLTRGYQLIVCRKGEKYAFEAYEGILSLLARIRKLLSREVLG